MLEHQLFVSTKKGYIALCVVSIIEEEKSRSDHTYQIKRNGSISGKLSRLAYVHVGHETGAVGRHFSTV